MLPELWQKSSKRKTTIIDETGKRYGKLQVISFNGMSRVGHGSDSQWFCKCDCGEERFVGRNKLTSKSQPVTECLNCAKVTGNRKMWATRGLLSKSESTVRRRVGQYLQRMKVKGGDLTKEDIRAMLFAPCYLCGDQEHLNGIDRLDSYGSYTTDNVESCCSLCNRIKHVMGEKEFLDHVRRIHAFRN